MNENSKNVNDFNVINRNPHDNHNKSITSMMKTPLSKVKQYNYIFKIYNKDS